MCDAVRSDAEYAGMAVYTPHGAESISSWEQRKASATDGRSGYIAFFVTERKRSEAMLVQVVQEAFVQGVSTRKMEKLAHSLGH